MNQMKTALFCFISIWAIFATTSVSAQTLTEKTSTVVYEDVKLTDSVSLDDGGVKTELKRISYGIRKKKVFMLAVVKIYVAEFFASEPTKLIKTNDGILNSLKLAGAVQLRITVSRDLTGAQISESFKEALKRTFANKIMIDSLISQDSAFLTQSGYYDNKYCFA